MSHSIGTWYEALCVAGERRDFAATSKHLYVCCFCYRVVVTGLHCLCLAVQAYQEWLQTEHDALVISNNDVLVPDGVIDDLLHAMTAEGTLPDCATLARYKGLEFQSHNSIVH